MNFNIIIILKLAGGVGIFLYGMNLMSLSLEKAAGSRMRNIIEICTKNRIFGVAAGMIVTVIIQSSSAATVMVVGFVNAGIMSLTQAAGVIIGANIGTTVTAQIVAFDLDAAAPIIAGIGAIAYLAVTKEKFKNTAQIFVGFGLLFTGIVFLKDSMSGLEENAALMEALSSIDSVSASSYFLLMLIGAVITIMVQSSSTVTGIMVAMAAQNLLSTWMAVPLILGSNLGTTFTAVLSSAGANRNAKRAACIHVIFNLSGVLIFVIFLQNIMVEWIIQISGNDIARQIANFHTAFNIITGILILPFINLLVKAAVKILPYREDEQSEKKRNLDPRMLETPSIAIKQVHDELNRMVAIVANNFEDSAKLLMEYNEEIYKKILKAEDRIDKKQAHIKDYLRLLMQKEISGYEHRKINVLFILSGNAERLGDNALNIAETAKFKMEHRIEFSDVAINDLLEMTAAVRKACARINKAVENFDLWISREIIAGDELIDELEQTFRKRHIKRLECGKCKTNAGIVFLEAISNMERVGDRIKKMAIIIRDFKSHL